MKEKIIGIPASPGIVIGKILVHSQQKIDIPSSPIAFDRVDEEITRFLDGLKEAESQLNTIWKKAQASMGEDEAEIFEGHLEILSDEDLKEDIISCIRDKKVQAEAAVECVIGETVEEMAALDSHYMQQRATDILDIGKRLLFAVAGKSLKVLTNLTEEVIVFAQDLAPSDTASMDINKVKAFVTEAGGVSSHVAIMAKSLELPAIVGAGEMLNKVNDGDIVIIDASEGEVILNPTKETLSVYRVKIDAWEKEKKELAALKDLPAETTDGHKLPLYANIGTPEDVEGALKHGAEGIGLYRTEFLFIDKTELPSEEEQFIAYKKVAKAMEGRSVIIRTIDIGGDKSLPCIDFPKEENPFLGWRAIRMCLDRPELFITQLRAILRASHYGKIHIMYPMVISIEEVKALNALFAEAKRQLTQEKLPFDQNIEVGIMIETPAAAVIAHELIEVVDFFSIGTNDLTQYTLAVDRGNQKIAHLYQPFHPAVLSLINYVISVSHQKEKWTGICGELGGDSRAAVLLMGMGIDELSMSASSIGKVKNQIRKHSMQELKEIANHVLEQGTTSDIINIMNELI